MPISTPEAMVPTTRPRSGRPARSLASGIRSWPATVVRPTSSVTATYRTPRRGPRRTPAARRPRAAARGDQPTAVQDVTERHDEQDADGVAELGRGDQPARRWRRGTQVAGDLLQQRLGPVQVADRRSTGDGEQQRQEAGHHRGAVRRGQGGHGRTGQRRTGATTVHAPGRSRRAAPGARKTVPRIRWSFRKGALPAETSGRRLPWCR